MLSRRCAALPACPARPALPGSALLPGRLPGCTSWAAPRCQASRVALVLSHAGALRAHPHAEGQLPAAPSAQPSPPVLSPCARPPSPPPGAGAEQERGEPAGGPLPAGTARWHRDQHHRVQPAAAEEARAGGAAGGAGGAQRQPAGGAAVGGRRGRMSSRVLLWPGPWAWPPATRCHLACSQPLRMKFSA